MENPASTSDLEAFGYEGPAVEAVQQRWLDAAWRALRRDLRRLGVDVVAELEGDELEEADVVDVVTAAALRVLRNPDGVKKDSGALDDYQESREFADDSQDIYFTAAELRRLQPPDPGASSGWSGSVKYS